MHSSEPPHSGRVGPDHARGEAQLRILQTGAASHHLTQKVVKVGPGYRLFIARPRGTPPLAGWPVLYMLDGNAAFDFLSPEDLARASGLVVIGVGYDTDRQFARELRTQDFTAPDGPVTGQLNGKGALRPDHVHPGRMAGGAAIFHDLLTGPLRAAAEAGIAVDPARRSLWGHSFGGLFVLYALLARPEGFARHAAISPSIWWDEALITRIAQQAPPSRRPLLVALGDREKRSGSDGPPPDGPAPATMQFVADLARHPGHQAQLHVLPGLAHIQTLAASFPLIFAFAQD